LSAGSTRTRIVSCCLVRHTPSQSAPTLYCYVVSIEIRLTVVVANTSVKQAGFYPWKINVTDDAVKADREFVFRFRPHRDPKDYNNAGPMAPSRGFILRPNTSSSSTSSTTSAVSLTSTPISSPTQKSDVSTDTNKGTPIGAIVGGILVGVAGLALITIGLYVLRLSKRRKAQLNTDGAYNPPTQLAASNAHYGGYPGAGKPSELDATTARIEMGPGQR
jgi:hypothetical protein